MWSDPVVGAACPDRGESEPIHAANLTEHIDTESLLGFRHHSDWVQLFLALLSR